MNTTPTLHAFRQYSKPASTLDKPEALARFLYENCGYTYDQACNKAGYNPMRDGKQIVIALGCLAGIFAVVMTAVLVQL